MIRVLIVLVALMLGAPVQAQVTGAFPAFYPPMTAGDCVQATTAYQATSTSAPCGQGIVSPGTINDLAWYATTGSTVSGLATANNGVLVTSSGGVPSIGSTLPSAVQSNITRTGTLVGGATGTGFTVALGTSTVTGILPAANGGAGSVTGALKANGSGLVTQAACADLSNGATGCSTVIGTSGATIPLLNAANTWSGVQSFMSGDLALKGASSGALTVTAAAAAGTNTLTFPAGTTDFSATGGTSQVVRQSSAGGAFTVSQLAASDLSNGTTGSGAVVLANAPTFTGTPVAPFVQLTSSGSTTAGVLGYSAGLLNYGDGANNHNLVSADQAQIISNKTFGTTTVTLTTGEVGLDKIAASGSAPGANGGKFALVCGTNAGSAKLIVYAGTSTTPSTILDNIGSGVTGC